MGLPCLLFLDFIGAYDSFVVNQRGNDMKTNVVARFMKLPLVLVEIGISRSTFIRYRKAGKLPEPFIISPRMHLWDIEQVREALFAANANVAGGAK